MNSWFKTEFVHEPHLVFGGRKEERDPKIGLARYGPFRYDDEESPLESIRIGIISNPRGLSLTLDVLDLLKSKIPTHHEQNQWLFPDYPGIDKESNFQCSIHTSKIWHSTISDDFELNKITSETLTNPNERIAYGVNLFVEKMREISANDDKPNVVICTLPKIVETYCGISERTRGAKSVKATQAEIDLYEMKKAGQTFLTDWGVTLENEEEPPEKSYDFRNALKGKIMEFDFPVQILHETTCEHMLNYNKTKKHTKQDPCSFAWNLSTALFYKANGKPWRLAKLPSDTCYVGISFFRDKLHPTQDIQISMAQVFTHTGDGLVLRGTEVNVDEHTKQAYLKKDQAKTLLTRAMTKYAEKAKQNPARVVIHKTSDFSDEEREGFNEAISEIGTLRKDFVTIRADHGGINFMRIGKFPPLRGTIIIIDDENFLLYTGGFTPRIRTYAGHSIPNPLKIKHRGDSSKKEVASEILGLTKLNWNTTSFSTFMPITIKFANEVGKILSELPEEKVKKDHYRFFM
jgi:hypothetical protein